MDCTNSLYNLQNHCSFHPEKRLVNLERRRREPVLGLSPYQFMAIRLVVVYPMHPQNTIRAIDSALHDVIKPQKCQIAEDADVVYKMKIHWAIFFSLSFYCSGQSAWGKIRYCSQKTRGLNTMLKRYSIGITA